MRRTGRARRGFAACLSVSVVLGSVLFGAAMHASADPVFDVVNGSIVATADHEIFATDQFSNFRTGAVDNYYPLAIAHVDGSPGAEARASVADTGPGFATVLAALNQAGSPVPLEQPQYAQVQYPPGNEQAQTFGSKPGPYASAFAQRDHSVSSASLVDTLQAGSSALDNQGRATMLSKLDRELRDWRYRFLSADDRYRYPMPRISAADPDAVQGDIAHSSATFDAAAGLLTLTTDASVARVSLGGGAIEIRGIHVAATITNNGTPQADSTVEVAFASVGGVPVIINQDGVSVNGSQVPGVAEAVQQASEALNAALAAAGIRILLLGAETTLSSNRAQVEAAGVLVSFTQPDLGHGTPNQNYVHILGEVRADSIAVPGAALPSPTTSPTTSTNDTGGTTTTTTTTTTTGGDTTGTGTGTGTTTQPGSTQPGIQQVVYKLPKPGWLVGLYFLWEAILVMTGLSLWWWRAEKLPTPSP